MPKTLRIEPLDRVSLNKSLLEISGGYSSMENLLVEILNFNDRRESDGQVRGDFETSNRNFRFGSVPSSNFRLLMFNSIR